MATEEQTIADDSNPQQVDGQISEQLGIDAPDATYSLELSQDQKDIRDWAHGFAEQTVRPAAHEWDEREEFPWPVVQEAAKIGLYGFESIAQFWADPSGLTFPIVNEELFWGDAGHRHVDLRDDARGRRHLRLRHARTAGRVGAAVLRRRERRQGRRPSAPPSPTPAPMCPRYRTTAKYDEAKDEWVINGQKAWATNGGIANVHVVIASVDRELGSRGHAAFVVPPGHQGPRAGRQGEEARHPRLAIPPTSTWTTAAFPAPACSAARRSSTSGSPRSARARAPRAQAAMRTFELSRPTVGAQAVGIARAAYEYSLDYAKERETFGQQDHREPGDRLHARRHEDGDRRRPAAGPPRRLDGRDRQGLRLTPRARCRSSRPARSPSGRPSGRFRSSAATATRREFPVERMHRDAKICTIFEGTSEIQRLVICRAISGVHIKYGGTP